MRPFEKSAMKAAILHHGLNTLNYNFVTFPRQKGADCLDQQLFNVIALAIVSKFAANNWPESIQKGSHQQYEIRSLQAVRFAVRLA